MQIAEVEQVVNGLMARIPEPVIDQLVDVAIIITDSPEDATEELKKDLGAEFDVDEDTVPADCKGIFVGEPTETEESDVSEEEEVVYYPEGFMVLCAKNIRDGEEAALVLVHEIGHALGLDESEVAALGLGVSPSPDAGTEQPKETGENGEQPSASDK